MFTRGVQLFLVVLVVATVTTTGCASKQHDATVGNQNATSPTDVSTTPDVSTRDELCEGKTRHVLVVGIDGLAAEAAQAANTPTLDEIAEDGASTFEAFSGGELGTDTQQPTLSGPGWTSILTGVWVDKHGVMSNEFIGRDLDAYPHFFDRLRSVRPDLRTASFVQWIPIRILGGETDADGFGDSRTVTDLVVEELRSHAPSIVFVHLDDIDHAGHKSGYGSAVPAYVKAIEDVDAKIGEMQNAISGRATRANECWATLVVTDHGGIDNNHGGQTELERTIPMFFGGDGIDQSTSESGPGHVVVPATVAAYLGIEIDPNWQWVGPPFGIETE